MYRFQAQLPDFEAALLAPAAGVPIDPRIANDVVAFIRGIDRKIRFAQFHSAVLTGVHWDRLDGIGRLLPGATQRTQLTILLSDASLTFDHADAVVDHVYVAFDGLMAAAVNMTDTIGRIVNLRYELKIDPKKASILSLKNYCAPNSPIAAVVNDVRHNDWLRRVRDLRGRCQHADVEHVLLASEGPYARRGQPTVPSEYDWRTPPSDLKIVDYASSVLRAAEETLVAVAAAVITAPENPLR